MNHGIILTMPSVRQNTYIRAMYGRRGVIKVLVVVQLVEALPSSVAGGIPVKLIFLASRCLETKKISRLMPKIEPKIRAAVRRVKSVKGVKSLKSVITSSSFSN